jgi:hypothetical protein
MAHEDSRSWPDRGMTRGRAGELPFKKIGLIVDVSKQLFLNGFIL